MEMEFEEILKAKENNKYSTKVAYFSMEFAIHQALKIYSGGLGFLSGSHMRSAYDLNQNVIGVGLLWSYGYYDQTRGENRSMNVTFRRKKYYYLKDTGVKVTVDINSNFLFISSPLHIPLLFLIIYLKFSFLYLF